MENLNPVITLPYEQEFNGLTLYIDESSDRWREGFYWSLCDEFSEMNSGFEFTAEIAFQEAIKKLPPQKFKV